MLYTYVDGEKRYIDRPKVNPGLIAYYKPNNDSPWHLAKVPLDGSTSSLNLEIGGPSNFNNWIHFSHYDDYLQKIIIGYPSLYSASSTDNPEYIIKLINPNTLEVVKEMRASIKIDGKILGVYKHYNPARHLLIISPYITTNTETTQNRIIIFDLLHFTITTKTLNYNNGNNIEVIGSHWSSSSKILKLAVLNVGNYTLNTTTYNYEMFQKLYIYNVNITSNEENVQDVFNWTSPTYSIGQSEPSQYPFCKVQYSTNDYEQSNVLFFRVPSNYNNYQYTNNKMYTVHMNVPDNKLTVVESNIAADNLMYDNSSQTQNLPSICSVTEEMIHNTYYVINCFTYNTTNDGNVVQYNISYPYVNGNVTNGFTMVIGSYPTGVNYITKSYMLRPWNHYYCFACLMSKYYTTSESYSTTFVRVTLSNIFANRYFYNRLSYNELTLYDSRSGAVSTQLPAYYGSSWQTSINYYLYVAHSKKYLAVTLRSYNETRFTNNLRYVNIIDRDNINTVQKLDCWQNTELNSIANVNREWKPITVVY